MQRIALILTFEELSILSHFRVWSADTVPDLTQLIGSRSSTFRNTLNLPVPGKCMALFAFSNKFVFNNDSLREWNHDLLDKIVMTRKSYTYIYIERMYALHVGLDMFYLSKWKLFPMQVWVD